MTAGTILIVDDDEDILTAGKLLLKRHYGRVVTCNRPEHIPDLLAGNTVDAILLDMNFGPGESSGREGLHWLGRILDIDPDAVVVLITAHGGVDMAVDAMKRGATDFITKPWQNEKVVATLSASVKLRQSRTEATHLKKATKTVAQQSNAKAPPIIGSTRAMSDLLDLVERAAPTDANMMILGENGTGKELVARTVHARSLRASGVFMSVDLGAISESLFESELFGHKKGAFTDAREDRVGLFEAAAGGTLFLDEVGNLPLHLQMKLLTALEQRRITPVGSTKPVDIDVRVLAATNMPLQKLKDEAHFRQDLLFRLNTVEVHVPPLRERVDDILPITRHYLSHFARKYGKPDKLLNADAEDALMAYHWPGNVRELRHAVERAMILSDGASFTLQDFALADTSPPPHETEGEAVPASELGEDLNLDRLEERAISAALKHHRYNISHAAKALGLTRAALYRRMEKYGL